VFILTCIVSAALQTITNEPPTAFRTITPILDQDWDSIPAEYKGGEDWEATFNENASRQFDVSLLHTFDTNSVYSVHFSSDGKYLATGCEQTAHIFDLQTGQRTSTVTNSDEITNPMRIVPFWSVRFSPDGGSLAVGVNEGSVRIWAINEGNIITERSIRTLVGHNPGASVCSLDWSRNGRLLASGSNDTTVRLWDVETGACILVCDAGAGVTSVAFSPDGKMVAGGVLDSVVRLWDTEKGTLVAVLSGHMDAVSSVAFSPDGRHLLSGSYDQRVRYWELGEAGRLSGVCKTTFRGHSAPVLSAAMTPDGEWIISGGMDRTLQLWNPVDGQPQFVLKGHTSSGN
jgi:general transcriptional corepressor TUP1